MRDRFANMENVLEIRRRMSNSQVAIDSGQPVASVVPSRDDRRANLTQHRRSVSRPPRPARNKVVKGDDANADISIIVSREQDERWLVGQRWHELLGCFLKR